jgi:hypothetical protein
VIGLFIKDAETREHIRRDAQKDFEENVIAQLHRWRRRGRKTRSLKEGLYEVHNPFPAFV